MQLISKLMPLANSLRLLVDREMLQIAEAQCQQIQTHANETPLYLTRAQDWPGALEFFRQGLDELAHLLDSEEPCVLELQEQLHSEIERVPCRKAKALQQEGDRAFADNAWGNAENCYVRATQEIACALDLESASLLEELRVAQKRLPEQKLEQLRADARAAFERGDWDLAEGKLDL